MPRWPIFITSLLLATGCLSPRKSEQSQRKAFANVDSADAVLGDIQDDTEPGTTDEDVALDEDVAPPEHDGEDGPAIEDVAAPDVGGSKDAAIDTANDGGVDATDIAVDGGQDAGDTAGIPSGFSARAAFSTTPATPLSGGMAARASGFISTKNCGGGYCAIGGWAP